MRCRQLLPIVLAVVCSAAVRADEPSRTQTNRMPEVTISSTRIPTEEQTTPSSVTVVTREQMEQNQTRTVSDALQSVPGVIVSQSGQPGGQTSVFLRGSNSGHTLVLVDGIRINNPFNGRYDFASLPVDNIDHIEVLRGPQSILYGSDAMGGVINIVTKRGEVTPTGAATFEGGSFNSIRNIESFAGKFGKLSLSGEGSYFSTDNDRINSENRVYNFSGRVGFQLLERLDLCVQGSYFKSHAGVPDDRFTNDPNDSANIENSFGAVTLHGEPASWWDAKLTVSRSHERLTFFAPDPNPMDWLPGMQNSLVICDHDLVDLQNVFTLAEQHKVLLGGSIEHTPSRYHSESPFGPATINRAVTTESLYGQYEFSPAERLTLTAGGRWDHFSTFGDQGTYRAGARFTTPMTETILRASIGTGFRAPTANDLYYPGYSNPNLVPERSLGWDAGIEQPLFDNKVRIGATYFQNEYDDLIAYSAAKSMPDNIAKAQTVGIETFAEWQVLTNLTLRGSYTWLPVAEDCIKNVRLLRRPEHTGGVEVHYAPVKWLRADASGQFLGTTQDMNFFAFSRVDNGGWVKLNLGLTATPCPHISVFVRCENLLDYQYEEAFSFPSLGRTFWGGATLRF